MSDGRDKQNTTKPNENHSSITFLDAHGKPKKKHTEQQHVYLAQQVSGIPQYGNVAPIAKKNVTEQSIKRENEDHNANGPGTPATGTSPEEMRRATAGANAKARADQSRLANQRELERDPMNILSATVYGFAGATGTEATRKGIDAYQKHNSPQFKRLQEPFTTLDQEIAQEKKAFARAVKGTPEYLRLQERLQSYKRLKLGEKKSADGNVIAEDEMAKLERGEIKGFSQEEVTRLKGLQDQERLLLAEKGEAGSALEFKRLMSLRNIGKGAAGATGVYLFDQAVSSNFKVGGHDKLAEFMQASPLEMMAIGGTFAAPVPKFVPGTGGPWYARLGARLLWEGGVDLSTKFLNFGYHQFTDPDVEKRNLEAAHRAQNEDHQKKTSDSMNSAIDAWKRLGNHNNQIQQGIDDAGSQIGTTDPAKLAQTRRDLVALYTAYGEARLNAGTRVGGPGSDGMPINGGPTKEHYLFDSKDYDFGGIAMRNLNAARNGLNELGISPSDPVAKRVYSSLSESDMSRILNPHKDLPDIYGQLRGLVHKNDPDATWLTAWMATRVTEQKKMLHSEEVGYENAKQAGQKFTPQFNNYVLAKVYQDQALLDMAYAAEGKDGQTHLKAAHDELKEAQRLGWDGREIKVNGTAEKRQSDLPKLIEMYRGLGGTVDW